MSLVFSASALTAAAKSRCSCSCLCVCCAALPDILPAFGNGYAAGAACSCGHASPGLIVLCDNSDDIHPEGACTRTEKVRVLLAGHHCTQDTIQMICLDLCRHASASTKQNQKKVEATEQSACPGHHSANCSCQTLLQIHCLCCAEDVGIEALTKSSLCRCPFCGPAGWSCSS